MAPFCPNLSNKKVREKFEELTDIFGEDMAYFLWGKNGGYPLDYAPNGAPSILFKSLMDHYGDRKQALIAKAKVYSSNFKQWFGDWTKEDKTDVSKVVDENGEPLVVYHGTSSAPFNTFDKNRIGSRNAFGTNNESFYFTDSKENAKSIAITMYEGDIIINGEPLFKSDYPFMNSKYISEIVGYKVSDNFADIEVAKSPYDVNVIKDYYKAIGKKVEITEVQKDTENIYPSFLNIKDMQIKDYGGRNLTDTSSIEFDNFITNTKDGGKLQNIKDGKFKLANTYFVKNPNQIKSATDNNGEFSQQSDNIYKNRSVGKMEAFQAAKEWAQKHVDPQLPRLQPLSKEQRKPIEKQLKEDFQKAHPSYKLNFSQEQYGKLRYSIKRKEEDDKTRLAKILFGKSYKSLSPETMDTVALMKELLRSVRGRSEHEEAIVRIIGSLVHTTGISIGFSDTLPFDVAAKYDANTKTIWITTKDVGFVNTNAYENTIVQTLMHELLHAITEEAINHNQALYDEIDTLRRKVIKELGDDAKLYGLTDVHEFIAELSNMEFIEVLKRIKVDKKLNMFQKILHIISAALNALLSKIINKNSGTAYSEAMQLLLKAAYPKEYKLPLVDPVENAKFVFAQQAVTNSSNLQESLQTQIIKQFSKLEKVYEKMPNKTDERQKTQDAIFEQITRLKSASDYEAAKMAIYFALDNLGTIDATTGDPTKKESVLGFLKEQSELPDPYSGITPQMLMDMYRDDIAFYDELNSDILPPSTSKMVDKEYRDARDKLGPVVDAAKDYWKDAMVVVVDRILDKYMATDFYAAHPEQIEGHRKLLRDYFHQNLQYEDISVVSEWMEDPSHCDSLVIKYMSSIIDHADTKIQIEANDAATDVERNYNKASRLTKLLGISWQKNMMEFDREGIPTGFFVRPINYGQYQLDLDEFVKKLNDKFDNMPGVMHHYIIDEATGQYMNSVTGQLAEDEEFGPNGEMPDIYKYLTEIEKWKCSHANRRYTIDYYLERMSAPIQQVTGDPIIDQMNSKNHGLSPKTLIRYNRIQSNINYYLDKCTDENGFTRIEKLSDEDLAKLKIQQNNLALLQNVYDENGAYKTGEDLQMAMEIRSWQAYVNQSVTTDVDYAQFDKELSQITDPAEKQRFIQYNTRYMINPSYMNQYMPKGTRGDEPLEVVLARYEQAALKDCVRYDNADTLEKDLAIKENDLGFWKNCKRVEQTIEYGKYEDPNSDKDDFKEHFKYIPQVYRDPAGRVFHKDGTLATDGEVIAYYGAKTEEERKKLNIRTWYDYMILKYYNAAITNGYIQGFVDDNGMDIDFSSMNASQILDTITKFFSYTDANGYIHPLHMFSNLYPTATGSMHALGKNGGYYTSGIVDRIPIGRFAEKNNPRLFNSNYDHTDHKSEQPLKSFYDNSEAWHNVEKDKNLYKLYNSLIKMMQQSQQDYGAKNTIFNYRLPKYEASNVAQMSRVLKNGYNMSDAWEAVKDSFTGKRAIDEDVRVNDGYQYSSDGTGLGADISLRYVGSLENRKRYSFDVTAAVLMYMHMAKNYKYKKQIEAELWSLRQALKSENRKDVFNEVPRTEALADNLLNMKLYGGTPTGQSAVAAKMSAQIRSAASLGVLANNFLSAYYGLKDATRVLLRDAFSGQYISMRDVISASYNELIRLPFIIANIGNPLANNLQSALMRRFGVGTQFDNNVSNIGDARAVKIAKKLTMASFSMVDYHMNAILLNAVMSSYRFYSGDNEIPAGFYTADKLEDLFVLHGRTISAANRKRLFETRTLLNAYKFKGGKAIVKDKYKQYVTPELEKAIMKTAKLRGGMVNGLGVEGEAALYKNSVAGQFFLGMRHWMVQRNQEWFSGRDDVNYRDITVEKEEYTQNGKTKVRYKVKKAPKTRQQLENAKSVNIAEGGAREPELAKASWRALGVIIRNFTHYITFGIKYKNEFRHLSKSERKAIRQNFVELAMLCIMTACAPFVAAWAFQGGDDDDDDYLDRENSSLTDVVTHDLKDYTNFFSKHRYRHIIYNGYIRTTASAYEQSSPFGMMAVLKSGTVYYKALEDVGKMPTALLKLMFDDDSDEKVKTGSYKGYTKFQRDMYVSSIILNQLHKSLSTQGIDENSSYYIKQFLLDAFFLKAFGYDYDALKKSTYADKEIKGLKYDQFGVPYVESDGFGNDPNAVLDLPEASPF